MRKCDIQSQMARLEKRITLVTLLSLSTLIVVKENKNIWAKILFAIVDILLIFLKKQEQNKGINFKTEDGTHGTSNWMSENEMKEILGFNDIPGIILGKYNNNIVKLPFDSYFNKNICVFGSSGSMKTIRFFINKLVRTFKI